MDQQKQIIEVVIAPDGTVKMDPTGFSGGRCQAATAPYEAALGTVTSDVAKPELRQAEGRVQTRQQARRG